MALWDRPRNRAQFHVRKRISFALASLDWPRSRRAIRELAAEPIRQERAATQRRERFCRNSRPRGQLQRFKQDKLGDPKHLGAKIGFLAVLHDHARWIRAPASFFLPVRVLSKVFRGKFVDGLKRLFRAKTLGFHGALRSLADPQQFRKFVRQLLRKDWVVYVKRPFRGPEYVLQYLARTRIALPSPTIV
jgi:hypothetical protein